MENKHSIRSDDLPVTFLDDRHIERISAISTAIELFDLELVEGRVNSDNFCEVCDDIVNNLQQTSKNNLFSRAEFFEVILQALILYAERQFSTKNN